MATNIIEVLATLQSYKILQLDDNTYIYVCIYIIYILYVVSTVNKPILDFELIT